MTDISEYMFGLIHIFFVSTSLGRLEGSGILDYIDTLLNHVYRSLWSNCSMLRALMVTELLMASVQQSYFSDQLLRSWPPEGTQASPLEDASFLFAFIKL